MLILILNLFKKEVKLSKSEKRKFKALNEKLQTLLSEQLDLELLLNPKIKWEEDLSKIELDKKYAGREFDISDNWKYKVKRELELKRQNGNWNESILNDNEEKRNIFYKLTNRKNNLTEIILKVIDELETVTGVYEELSQQAESIFT